MTVMAFVPSYPQTDQKTEKKPHFSVHFKLMAISLLSAFYQNYAMIGECSVSFWALFINELGSRT